MFKWSNTDYLPASDDIQATNQNLHTLFESDIWSEHESDDANQWSNEPTDDAARSSRANQQNMADHALLSHEQEIALAKALQKCFRLLQKTLAQQPAYLSHLIDHISQELWIQTERNNPELLAQLDSIITTHDHWQLLHFQACYEPNYSAQEEKLFQQLLDLFSKADMNRDFVLDLAQSIVDSVSTPQEQRIFGLLKRLYDIRNQLVQSNIRLVYHIAKRHREKGMEFEDMVQEGILGLIRATIKFDAEAGVRFSTYGFWWIQQAIRQALAKQRSLIRYPTHVTTQVNKLYAFLQDHNMKSGAKANMQQIQKHTGLTRKKITDLRSLGNLCISADEPVFEDGGKTLLDELFDDVRLPTPDSITEKDETHQRLRNMLESLSEREAMIVRMKYGIDHHQPYSLNEIAPQIGVSRERVRQILDEAIGKLKLLPD